MNEQTARCVGVCPIMPTTDIRRSVLFYEALGYAVQVHGDFIMTKRDSIELFLSLMPDHDPKRTAACVFIRVENAEVLHAHWQNAGDCVKQLRDTPYRMREFSANGTEGMPIGLAYFRASTLCLPLFVAFGRAKDGRLVAFDLGLLTFTTDRVARRRFGLRTCAD
jgi:hypothetical protein